MRVLVVEDDAKLGRAMAQSLIRGGYACDVMGTVAHALHALSVENFDAIVLDLGLPDGDGLTLVKTLRARARSVPILVMTARSGLDDRIAGLDLGADDYLVKPFATGELAARCRALLRRSGAWGF